MLNDPQPPDRRHPLADPPRKRHPLEEAPAQRPAPRQQPPRQGPQIRLGTARPTIMWLLIAINSAVFALEFATQNGFLPGGDQLFAVGVQRSYEVLVQGQYYRLLTAMFMHLDPVHIFLNMYALYLFGRSIESIFGHSRFTIIYFLGGFTGSILSVVLGDPSPRLGIPSLGASGAIFAVFAAEMVFLYRNRELLGPRAQTQFRSLVFLMVINAGIGIASQFSQSGVRIDMWGHVGGFIGGVILAAVLGPIFIIETHPDKPGVRVATDTNPLAKNVALVVIYSVGLIAILAYFSYQVRGFAL